MSYQLTLIDVAKNPGLFRFCWGMSKTQETTESGGHLPLNAGIVI